MIRGTGAKKCTAGWKTILCAALVLLCLGPTSACAQRRGGSAKDESASKIDAEKIDKAIEKGVVWLLRQQQPDGSFYGYGSYGSYDASNARIALALLECRVPLKNPQLQRLLNYIVSQRSVETQFLALRAEVMVLAAAAGGNQKAAETQIGADLKVVLANQAENGFWRRRANHDTSFDLSYDVFQSLLTAATAGYRVADKAMLNSTMAYLQFQNNNGGWGYNTVTGKKVPSDPDATLRAVSCLMAYGRDQSYSDDGNKLNDVLEHAVKSALENAGDNYRMAARAPSMDGWLLQRNYFFGRLLRYIPMESYGKLKMADWVNPMIGRQEENGRWSDVSGTAATLYMLAQLRARPVIAEITDTAKPPLANRVLVNLTQQMSSWLPVSVTYAKSKLADFDLYKDLPLILMEIGDNWKPTSEETELLQKYVTGGGTILLNVDLKDKEVNEKLADKLAAIWPGTRLAQLHRNDAMWAARQPQPDRPVCYGIHDGVRTFLFAIGRDVFADVSVCRFGPRNSYLSMLNNIAVYATENRLESPGPLNSGIPADKVVSLAGQKIVAVGVITGKASIFEKQAMPAVPYNGFAAAAKLIPKAAGLELLGPKPLNAAHKNLPMCDLAYLPLYPDTEFDEEELAGLKQYVSGGGFLFVEARLGETAVERVQRKLFEQLGLTVESARDSDFLVGKLPQSAAGFDVSRMPLRKDGKLGTPRNSDLRLLKLDEKIVGFYSPLDVVVSASGIPCFGLRGYATDDARRLLANILAYRTAR